MTDAAVPAESVIRRGVLKERPSTGSRVRLARLGVAVLGLAFATGCGSTDTPAPIPTATSSSTPTPASSPTSEQPPPTTTVESPAGSPEQSADPEPFVIECLEGTPGPARWSDGTLRYSQWCFDQLCGEEYLQREREANTFECDGVVCRNPYTGGTYPDPAAQAPVGTTSTRGYSCYDNGCFWPDGTPVIGADRCGLRCGEPPTSGELQTQHGCEQVYIDDPELCAAVGR